MKILLCLLGLGAGAVIGALPGALVGLLIGTGLALLLSHETGKPASASLAFGEVARLTTRLSVVETQMAKLQSRLAQLENSQPSSIEATTEVDMAATAPAPELLPSGLPRRAAAEPAASQHQAVEEEAGDLDTQALATAAPALAAVKASGVQPTNALTRAAQVAPPPTSATAVQAPPKPPQPPPRPLKERMPPFLRQWIFGGNTIVKVGVLILFFGLAFLLRYAAERITVPIELRYAAVALVGAMLLGVGWRLRHGKDKAGGTGFGQILQGAGIGVFYLTTLGALKLSQLLPPELAFGFLFLASVFATLLAVAQSAPWLAYVAAAGGFAAPVLVSTGGGGNHLVLFSYLAILDLGIFLVAGFK
ncbi:MAG: hypothetical protein JWP29_4077, partial [Rhodoferax sp.]|nr:hypothetical protein [Rhodoferax sp.]